MKMIRLPLLLSALLAAHATGVNGETPAATDRLPQLDEAQIGQALQLLRGRHVRGGSLEKVDLERATLRGLLDELAPGAALTGAPEAPAGASPFRAEVLDGRAGYVRVGSLQTEHLAELEAALEDFAARRVQGVVLDLRATPPSDDFAMAAQFAERFCPPGRPLFSLEGADPESARTFSSSRPPDYHGVLIVLVDENTAGAAEALAATLRWHAKALLVGTRTSGRAVEWAALPLGDDHHLRLAVAEVTVGGQRIYPRGLRPDVEIAQDPRVREAVLTGAMERGAAVYLYERERAQMNEAALVAGTWPEADDEDAPPALIDRPLQRAIDLVTALQLFGGSR